MRTEVSDLEHRIPLLVCVGVKISGGEAFGKPVGVLESGQHTLVLHGQECFVDLSLSDQGPLSFHSLVSSIHNGVALGVLSFDLVGVFELSVVSVSIYRISSPRSGFESDVDGELVQHNRVVGHRHVGFADEGVRRLQQTLG